jgi:gas vesicle protein
MGQEPEAIRREIEQQRDEMSDTVDALGYKADVKTRTKEAISDRKDALVSKVSGNTPDSGDVKQGAKKAAGVAQENPLGLAIGAAAVGFVAGMLIPSTSVEDEKVGPLADQVKEKAKETGQEALERGKQVAEEAADSAKTTVQESGQQHAEELRQSAAENADEAREPAQQGTLG